MHRESIEPSRSRVRVLLCDDHEGVRAALRMLLSAEADFEVVGEAGDGATLLKRARELVPDVILLDISLPDLSGLAVAKALRDAGSTAKLVALSVHEDQGYVDRMRAAGAVGYVVKRRANDALVSTIRQVVAPDRPTRAEPAASRPSPTGDEAGPGASLLSERETEILKRVASGQPGLQIAEALALAAPEIEEHKAQAMEKLGLRTRSELVRFAARCGWLKAGAR